MKRVLTALLLTTVLVMAASAAPHFRPRRPYLRYRPRRTAPHHSAKILKEVPWQLVVSGGMAVGGIVFAYKVADGIQQGLVEVAHTSPAEFTGAIGGVGGTVQTIAAVIVIAGVGYLVWRLARLRDWLPPKPPPKLQDNPEPDEGPPQ